MSITEEVEKLCKQLVENGWKDSNSYGSPPEAALLLQDKYGGKIFSCNIIVYASSDSPKVINKFKHYWNELYGKAYAMIGTRTNSSIIIRNVQEVTRDDLLTDINIANRYNALKELDFCSEPPDRFISPCPPVSDADSELLTILMEECAETAARASKIIRFGASEIQPGHDLTNIQRMSMEFGDIMGTALMLVERGLLDVNTIYTEARKKPNRIRKYSQKGI